MREKAFRRSSVLIALLFALVTALTGFALLFGGGTHASAAEGDTPATPTEKALYFVDAGRLVKTGTESSPDTYEVAPGREGGGGTYWDIATPFMEHYGLSYSSTENPNGLFNRVADKPFFNFGGEENRCPQTDQAPESTIDGSGKAWGFLRMNGNGTEVDTSKYYWEQWSIGATNTTALGSETMRHADSGTLSVAYKFEVPENQKVKITFGSSVFKGWGNKTFTARCGSSSIAVTANDTSEQVHTFEGTFEGTKETYGGVEKNIVTVSFGPDGYVSWILVTTPGYYIDCENETACVRGGTTGSVNLLAVTPGNATENQTVYARGTIDATEMADKINKAEVADFTYVENVKVTLDNGKQKTVKVLVLPSYTKYFVNAGHDAKYNASHGYGYTDCVGDNKRSGIDNPYKTSVRFTGGKITYQFDVAEGIYAVDVASKDPWWNNNDRVITVTLNNERKEDMRAGASAAEAEPNVGHYITKVDAATGKLTLELAAPDGVKGADPVISYIHVYEMEEVITYDTQGGSAIFPTVRTKGSADAVTVTTEVPTRSGYTFRGWYTKATDGEKVEAGASYPSAITLYAQWDKVPPSEVTFIVDGVAQTPIQVEYSETIPEGQRPAVPKKDGYYFAGWFNGEGAGATEFDPATDAVTTDLTLTARWNVDPLAAEEGYTVVAEEKATSFAYVSNWYSNLNHDGRLFYLGVGQKAIAVYTIEGGTGWNAGVVLSFLYGGTRYNLGGNSHYGFNNATETKAGDWWNNKYNANATITGGPSDTHGTVYNNSSKKITQYAVVERKSNTQIIYTVKSYDTQAVPFKDALCQTTYTVELPDLDGDFSFRFAFDEESSATAPTALKTATVKYLTNNADYKLTFDENKGSGTPATYTQRGGTTYNVQYTPRDGYKFRGWQYDTDQWQQTGDLVVTRDYTFTAQWQAHVYAVTLNYNGAQESTPATIEATYGAEMPTDLPATLTKTGYTFKGWYTEENGAGTKIEGDNWTYGTSSEEAKPAITLYAHFEVNTYTITYELYGGENESGAPTSYTYGEGVETLPTPTKDGYRFDGWFTDAAGTTEVPKISETDSGNKTLHAHWTQVWTVSFDLNGATGTAPTAIANVANGATVSTAPSPAPTRDGYTFGGWYTDEECTTAFTFGTTTVTANTTLYAKWTANEYTITFDVQGGNTLTPNTKTVTYGQKVGELPTPQYDGHNFHGWYLTTAHNTQITADTVWEYTEDKTLYAYWVDASITTYTVSFNLNYTGAEGTPTDISGVHADTAVSQDRKPADPERTGYTFDGWYTDEECTTEFVFGTTTVTANVTLYAKWTANTYTVTFNSQGGSSVTAATVEAGGKVTKPADPTRDGYTFGGWYTEAACTTAWDFTSDTVTENTTLYAKWTENAVTPPTPTTYAVTFNSQGGSAVASANVTSGGKVTKPTDPTREGYTFGGWYKEAACTTAWDFNNDTVTANTTLYAKWTENSTPAPAPAPSDDGGKKKGCGSSVMAETSAIVAVLMLAFAAVVVLKKKASAK